MMGTCDVCGEYTEVVNVIKADFTVTQRCYEHVRDKEDFRGEEWHEL